MTKINEDTNVEEQEIEQASIILGIRAVIDRLQEIGVQLSTLGAKQLMPLMSRTQLVFGDEYTKDVTETGNTAIGICIDAIQKAKNMLASETLKLEGKVSGLNNDLEKADGNLGDEVTTTEKSSGDQDEQTDSFGAVETRAGPSNEPVAREKKEESLAYFQAYKTLKENIKKGNFPIYTNIDNISEKICESWAFDNSHKDKIINRIVEWFKTDYNMSPEEFTIEYELGKAELCPQTVDSVRYRQLVNIHMKEGFNKNLSLVKAAEDYYEYFGVDPRVKR
jgi:hypothetical protein